MIRTFTTIVSLCRIGLLVLPLAVIAEPAKITVDLTKPGHPVSPTLWGVFFEDINLSADGGLYPELVRNRSFEDGIEPENWKLIVADDGRSSMTVDVAKPLNPLNPRNLRVKVDGAASLENEGYWGMNMVAGDPYTFKVAARAADGFNGPLTVRLLGSSGKDLAHGEISRLTSDWKYYTLALTPSASDSRARLQMSFSGRGTLFLDMVSVMPNKTWKDHGLRPDLAESLVALKPSFFRFPGGCWVEGEDRAHMYNWKKTIGDVDTRTPLYNIWGYNATHGLGFHEYLQMAEDLGASPVFCVNVGMSHKESVPMDQMALWVRDALDAIEYANGTTNSYWGALRAKHGHPAPFNLKRMEIGNENGGADYRQRWPLFVKAIKAEYPEMELIANHWQGSYPENPMPDMVDEHYYDTPEFFMQQASRYDNYDRKGPKVFVGEYAVTRNCGKGNLRAAIGEAAFMTGIERNSDIVSMACYAPLFVNVNHRKWNPDLINFDSSRWYGLPSYYVQQLFSKNRGDTTVPTSVQCGIAEEPQPAGRIGVGTWNTRAEFKDVKVTALDGKVLFASSSSMETNDWKFLGEGTWKVADGALQQTAEKEFVRALAGSKSWTDYTLELKARKIAGQEGFLILFHIGDEDDRVWWNLGGWKNTRNAVEWGESLDSKAGSIETGRWYDIRVQVEGKTVKCWLDGKLIHDIKKPRLSTATVFASATRSDKTGEIILKVVNTASIPTETEINLNGLNTSSSSAQAIVLTSGDARDENTLEAPTQVSPRTSVLSITGSQFTRTFPGNSLTILRVSTGK